MRPTHCLAPRRTKLQSAIREIAERLQLLSFEGDIWGEVLAALRGAFEAELACKYLPERVPEGWAFDSMHLAGGPGVCTSAFRSRVLPSLGQHFSRHTFFDPLSPEPAQRNRTLLLRDITEIARRPMGAMREYMSHLGINGWDQLRVLVCDGPRLLSWVGLFSERAFTDADRAAFQEIVPALEARLRFDQLTRSAAHAGAALQATLDAMPSPCFLLHASGRLLDANAAGELLRNRDPGLMARINDLVAHPDPRFDLHPIRVCGLTASYLATLRAPFNSAPQRHRERARQWGLTKRQTTVLACLVEGMANKDIAARLGIAPGTVELHVSALLSKAEVESRSALLAAYWGAL